MIKPILQKDDSPVLRQIASPVIAADFGTKKLKTILSDMSQTLDAATDGVAIAAPQIGISQRIFVVSHKVFDWDKAETPFNAEFINPVIIKKSKALKTLEEGCLSIKQVFGQTKRADKVTVEAYNFQGQKFSYNGSGLLAQIFQHEIDHLNGILFCDHATNLHEIND